MTRVSLIAAALSASFAGTTVAEVLIVDRAPDDLRAEILFLPDDAARLDAPAAGGETRLRVTGAYSSGDRFAPEGMVVRDGRPTHPWPQGWDGLLVVEADGGLAIHDVSAVRRGERAFDLRDRAAREAFLAQAARDRVSIIQSHLLIKNGELDLQPVEGARTFRRRMLFETADGRIGVYDTSPRMLTLYDAAEELLERVGPAMALNLDMGAYDFCEVASGAETQSCGVLSRDGLGKLTNIIQLTAPAGTR